VGHSDGDALLHAVTDAVLGALGEPDIGRLFPDSDPRHEGADSRVFLEEAVGRMKRQGWAVGNLDATIICERPRIAPHAEEMANTISALLGCDRDRVNIKGKTHEQVDAVGEGRAIEVHVVILLHPASEAGEG
jgi:2-C-methyl-D-erythritol 2,4-cyclodiphosphate synthase